jgi:hypothetical protein
LDRFGTMAYFLAITASSAEIYKKAVSL